MAVPARVQSTQTFLQESWGELRKVTWPDYGQLKNATLVVLVFVILISAIIWLMDVTVRTIITWIMGVFESLMIAAGKRWYAIQTYSGHENKVQKLIARKIEDESGETPEDKQISTVLVPTQDVLEIRNGKRVTVTRRLYPGYVLVQMVLNERTMHVINNIQGVIKFVGTGQEPRPLRDEEINKILGVSTGEEEEEAHEEIPFHVGQVVEITQGPFTDFSGTVQEVFADKGKVKVEVSLFGRPTSVELGLHTAEGVLTRWKKVVGFVKLHVPGGQANPAPPVGPALGQHGVNIMEFCKQFNTRTQNKVGFTIPVEITIYRDRSFTFITKTPPAAVLIRKAAGVEKGSGVPEPREGGEDHEQAAARDRPNEASGPEHQEHRVRHKADRWDGPLDGGSRSRRRERLAGSPGEPPGASRHRWEDDTRRLDGMPRHGRRFYDARKRVPAGVKFAPDDAVQLVKELSFARFDETVEVATRLSVDPRKADQIVRGTVVLPHGTGKTVRVYVATQGEKENEAHEAGADYVGLDGPSQDPGGVARVRRHGRHAGCHGEGRAARSRAGPPWADADPEGRHGHLRRGQGRP